MRKSVLYSVVGEVYVLLMGWLCGSSDGGRNVGVQTNFVQQVHWQKERKKERRMEWGVGDGSVWV